MSTVLVRYVGLKPTEVDSKKGKTGVVWNGHGDVQAVPAEAWPKLAPHADVWELVEGQTAPQSLGLADAKPAQEVDDEDLKAMTVKAEPVAKRAAEPAPEPATEPMRVESDSTDLYNMNTAALREYAVGKGYDVDLTLKGQALRTAINLAGG